MVLYSGYLFAKKQYNNCLNNIDFKLQRDLLAKQAKMLPLLNDIVTVVIK